LHIYSFTLKNTIQLAMRSYNRASVIGVKNLHGSTRLHASIDYLEKSWANNNNHTIIYNILHDLILKPAPCTRFYNEKTTGDGKITQMISHKFLKNT
jgi:hypothetical protein